MCIFVIWFFMFLCWSSCCSGPKDLSKYWLPGTSTLHDTFICRSRAGTMGSGRDSQQRLSSVKFCSVRYWSFYFDDNMGKVMFVFGFSGQVRSTIVFFPAMIMHAPIPYFLRTILYTSRYVTRVRQYSPGISPETLQTLLSEWIIMHHEFFFFPF